MVTTSSPRGYRAAVLGGTGAVGSALVRELLASPDCAGVTAFVRRVSDLLGALPHAGKKLSQRVVSMDGLEHEVRAALTNLPRHRIAFSTLGVGQPSKVSREEHWKVDVEYNAAFARAMSASGAEHFSLLSSVGTDPGSRVRYLRVKATAEAMVRDAGFRRVSFFRPSMLITPRYRYGLVDVFNQSIFPRLSWLLPARYHEIRVESLGRAMRINAERAPSAEVEILEYPSLVRLLASEGGKPLGAE